MERVPRAGASSQDRQATIQHTLGGYQQRADLWNLQAQEASTTFQQLGNLIDAAKARLTVRTQQQADWQTTIANLQKQIDFMTGKFTNQQLYDWMSNTLYNLYLQAYNLAYGIAKGAEHCYRYELVLPNASFIQFNYWNSLYQGLLAGEGLMTDLLSMQSSYLSLNARRYEISRIYSLAKLKPLALIQLLQTGACDFSIDEPHFDEDYPGHYQRQLKRVSITVVYPSPGKNDNVSCTLTLVANKVRMNASLNLPYPETPPGNDPRFAYQYGAVQTIVTSQAQDDPGLFENQIHYQVTDPRYLPFEGAGAISDWHMELPSTNEVDVTTVGDVQIHLLYTALDGGPLLQQAAIASLAAKSQGSKMFSAANDFSAPAPNATNPYPLSPWQSFFAPAANTDQLLTLALSASKFPSWTRGKTITVTAITAYAISWTGSAFVIEPQGVLPSADVVLSPLPGQPALVAAGAIANLPAGLKPGTWSFKLKEQSAGDFRSLSSGQIGDLILKIDFTVQ